VQCVTEGDELDKFFQSASAIIIINEKHLSCRCPVHIDGNWIILL